MPPAKASIFNQTTIRFFLVGALGAVVELLFFSGLTRAGLGIIYSNFIAFHCAFTLCFFLHYLYTYQKPYEGTQKIFGGFTQYAALMYAQLAIGSIVLWLLVDKLFWIPEIAKVVQIGAVTPMSYIIQKLIIFRLVKKN